VRRDGPKFSNSFWGDSDYLLKYRMCTRGSEFWSVLEAGMSKYRVLVLSGMSTYQKRVVSGMSTIHDETLKWR
jgi:hypothetical protein